ncbi:DinB family protein [Bacillus sp. T3]|uniref:DinB family protein n=1 Tax=Bacillus sp. T3 TaxID=467262 RepID=UPI0029812289|nr:DinB family protein [Bacillus sp. T3]
MAEKTVQGYRVSIQKSIEQVVQVCKSLPEEVILWKPSEEEWSILQILSHINEAVPYWLNEVKRVIENPGSEWGRGLQDEKRLAAVTNTASLSVESTLKAVEGLEGKVLTELSQLTEEQLIIESPHRNFAKFGNKPVSFIIGHFIDEHLEGHLQQIQRNLSKVEKVK